MNCTARFTLFVLLLANVTILPGLNREHLLSRLPGPDGRLIDKISVPGIPVEQRVPGPAATPGRDAVILPDVPAFNWCYGCSATSAAMIAGYYDRTTHINVYAGPTGGGVMPLNNSYWGPGECPLSATHQGYDGLLTSGHVDRFWTNNAGPDPFGPGDPTETYYGCTADYMGTNQDWWGNGDGSTTFYYYVDGSPLHDPLGNETEPPCSRDGSHGLKLFFASRGYNVLDTFNQYIHGWDGNTIGFTLDQYKSAIDNGFPVMIQIEGHSMVGFGYEINSDLIYIRNTWDHQMYSMTWGGVYSGMAHCGVSVIQLAPPPAMNVSGLNLSASLICGQTGTSSFLINNAGSGELQFSLDLEELSSEIFEQGIADSPASRDGRNISGSTLTLDAIDYLPGCTYNWTFFLYNASTDDEWLKYLYLDFPPGVNVISATNFTGGGGGDLIPDQTSGNGITISWGVADPDGWGVVYNGNTATATVSVSIGSDFSGDLDLPFTILGDVYGTEPHTVNGEIVLAQQSWPLSWFHALPANGIVPANASQTITGYFSALGLEPGLYTARITVSGNDPLNPSQIVEVSLQVDAPVAPVICSIAKTSGGIRICWEACPGASEYILYRSSTPSSTADWQISIDPTVFEYTDPLGGGLEKAFYWIKTLY